MLNRLTGETTKRLRAVSGYNDSTQGSSRSMLSPLVADLATFSFWITYSIWSLMRLLFL